jgi:hypothetical protein
MADSEQIVNWRHTILNLITSGVIIRLKTTGKSGSDPGGKSNDVFVARPFRVTVRHPVSKLNTRTGLQEKRHCMTYP